tara:strand:+ start:739 stop:879 length:141 start_codon:yes stop_codon:yes gene_type:complete
MTATRTIRMLAPTPARRPAAATVFSDSMKGAKRNAMTAMRKPATTV